MPQKRSIAIVFGTRPEGIKLAPVIHECRKRADRVDSLVINTGQHLELLRPVLEFFSVPVDLDLAVMCPDQSLAALTGRVVEEMDRLLSRHRPDCLVVQGDTTTAMAAAMAAFYQKIPVAHVEAGLRTDDLYSPFPEELNRRVVSQIARLHLAPTDRARSFLVRDGVEAVGGQVVVTGNTVIDALYTARELVRERPFEDPTLAAVRSWKAAERGRRVILVTGHRRENFGEPFHEFCAGLRDIGLEHPNALLVYPVHLNPNVQAPVRSLLGEARNVVLTPPKDYPTFVALMSESDFVITDSGGVQEEAPALGKPVLVTRSVTERPEGVEAGVVQLVGPQRAAIVSEAGRLLTDDAHFKRMAAGGSPYGDGKAAERIVRALLGEPVQEFRPVPVRSRSAQPTGD